MLESMSDAAVLRAYKQARSRSSKATEARAALPPGSSRAKVTTANARWAQAAEARDLYAAEYLRRHPDWEGD